MAFDKARWIWNRENADADEFVDFVCNFDGNVGDWKLNISADSDYNVYINGELASAMLLSAGISTAASAPALAQKNGADVPYTAVFTLGSTLLCMITLPLLWLLFEFLF